MTQHYSLAEMLPSPKRLKHRYTPDYSTFQPGSIIRCKLTNFMSYSLTEFHFGPRMNLIIGPNGSGKSTFVCAVCIGLNGKLANLGKESMNTDGFIKDNTNSGTIELELKDHNDGTIIITTYLVKNKKTTWQINGSFVTESEIKKLLKSFNIQLDNLCQFLSQDRVSKFADLKSEDLLKEIERSYRNGELLEDHNEIIKLQAQINLQKKKFDESIKELDELKSKNDSLKEKADKFRHFKKLQLDYEKTEMVRPYVKVQDMKLANERYRTAYSEEKKNYSKFLKEIAPITNLLNASDQILVDTENQVNKIEKSNVSLHAELEICDDQIQTYDKKIQKYLSQMEDYEIKLSHAKDEYHQLQNNHLKLENAFDSLNKVDENDLNDWRQKVSELNEKILILEDEVFTIRGKISSSEQQMKALQQNINNEKNRLNSTDRLSTIDRRKYAAIYKAVHLLRQLKETEGDEFNCKYTEPALITLNVTNKRIGPAVETLIPFRQLNAIVLKDNQDYVKISKFLYEKYKCMISLRTLGSGNFNINDNRLSYETIKNLGFDGFLTDYLEGPKEVIQMLCENLFLNQIPISLQGLTNEQKSYIAKEVEKGLNLVKYVNNDEIYTMNRSRFGTKQISTSITLVKKNSQIFERGLSEDQKNSINDKIKALEDEYKESLANVENLKSEMEMKFDEASELKGEKNQYDNSIEQAKAITREERKIKKQLLFSDERILAQKNKIKSIKQSNKEENKEKMYDKIDKFLNEKLKVENIDKQSMIVKRIQNDTKLVELKIRMIEEKNKIDSIKKINTSIDRERHERRQKVEELRMEYEKVKKQYKTLCLEYREKLMMHTLEEKETMKDVVQELAQNGGLTEENLNLKLLQMESEMKLNNKNGGENSLKQLEETQEKLKLLEMEIPKIEEELKNNNVTIADMCAKWEEQLDHIVSIISKDFDANMRKIASAGDVKLDKSSEDYSKWKLILQVSFRDNEELSNFNGAQHSGGEKSTTTAVFLNSLQGLTNTPFRVVDEINQGMDSKNERRAHELIVKRATDRNVKASQYFLITPKLLSDLYYGPDMTVHCIFAGRWCPVSGKPDSETETAFLEMGVTAQYI